MNMLFLTNHQAKAFDFSDIEKVMNAMDITPRPKLIVTLFKSYVHLAGTLAQEIHPDEDEFFTPHNYVAETDRSRLEDSNRKIATFLKEHLLPVCIKTHAIVFLNDDSCALSHAFGNICVTERNKRNGVLPFTTMTITGAHVVANRAQHDENSIARLVRRGSRRWRQYNNKMVATVASCLPDRLHAFLPATKLVFKTFSPGAVPFSSRANAMQRSIYSETKRARTKSKLVIFRPG